MAIKLQLRRGTAEQNDAFTGALGEPSFNTTSNSIRIHDGSTQGGHVILGESHITNCITEIPQDIKLELNNGVLKLKAGSKVYAPNGVGVFDTRNVTTDQTYTQTTDGQYLLSARQDTSIWGYTTDAATSGTTPPAGTGTFYNTTTNSIDFYNGGIYNERHYSFPFALITVSNGAISSIDQVFNGFGYIGSTVFSLPGVKYVAPKGRNPDGTLKTYSNRYTDVKTWTASNITGTRHIVGFYTVIAGHPTFYQQTPVAGAIVFDTENNISYSSLDIVPVVDFGTVAISSGRITALNINTAFQAVDYNYIKNISGLADNADYVIESEIPTAANNYTWYRKYRSGWVEQGGSLTKASFSLSSGTNTTFGSVTFPIEMMDNGYTFALGDDMAFFNLHAQSKTTTGFNVIVSNQLPVSYTNGDCSARWQVSGIAA